MKKSNKEILLKKELKLVKKLREDAIKWQMYKSCVWLRDKQIKLEKKIAKL